MKVKAKWWIALAGAGVVASLSGCNIYEPFYSKRASSLDYQGLIIRGTEALNDGDYVTAEYYYAKAKERNYKGSVAYLFHAQAVVLKYDLNFTYLKNEFDGKRGIDPVTGQPNRGVPFVGPTTTIDQINRIYFPVYTAVQDAEHILRQKSQIVCVDDPAPVPPATCRFPLMPDGDTASDGHVGQGVARLDLGLLQAIKGMLAALDMDQDGRITADSCGYNICPNPLDSMSCASAAARVELKRRCRDGIRSEEIRFDNFKKLTENVQMDNLDSKDVNARHMSTDPNDINDFIESMVEPIARSVYNLDSVENALNNHNDDKLVNEISGVVANVRDLGNFLGYMRYNDALDNDFDSSSAVSGGRMQWHDYDRDHGVRFNYGDGSENDGVAETGNIGHPVHRQRNQLLYYKFNELAALSLAYAQMRADTGKNSRFNLMRKKCRDKVDGIAPVASGALWPISSVPRVLLDGAGGVCDSLSPILKRTVPVPFPGTSDWIGGPVGVDEEMIDEFDNDYDGLKDEDARNMRGFDDDDDAVMTSGLYVVPIGQNPVPMAWQDAPTHDNKCPDWDLALPMFREPSLTGTPSVDYHLNRQNCIGSLENRFWIFKTYGDTGAIPRGTAQDTLRKYYSEVGDGTAPNDTNKNCMDEWRRKLDANYKAVFGLDFAAAYRVCHYKSIWNANQPIPPRSEWTGGNYGIDEERLDGVDNDGDGWIDEDLDNPTIFRR